MAINTGGVTSHYPPTSDSWDGKYTNGDDLNYALGLVSQRVLSFPAGSSDGPSGHQGTKKGLGVGLKWNQLGKTLNLGLFLEVDINNLITNLNTRYGIDVETDNGVTYLQLDDIGGSGLTWNSGTEKLSINQGKGIFIGTNSGDSYYDVVNINLYAEEKPATGSGSATVEDKSGLEFVNGEATTGKPANDQLRIKLEGSRSPGTTTYSNCSGLAINFPTSTGSGAQAVDYSGGLTIIHDNTLSIGSDGKLKVNPLNILPNVSATLPITATQDNNYMNIAINLSSSFSVGAGNLQLVPTSTTILGGVIVSAVETAGSSNWGQGYAEVVGANSNGLLGIKLASNGSTGFGVIRGYADSGETVNNGLTRGVKITTGSQTTNGTAYITQVLRSIATGSSTPTTATGLGSTDTNLLWLKQGTNISITAGSASSGVVPITFDVPAAVAGTNATATAGVSKLYTSIGTKDAQDQDVDINTDGSVTQAALTAAYNSIIEAIGNLEGVKFEIKSSLPDISTEDKYKLNRGTIVLIPISGASSPDVYSEYVAIDKGSSANPRYVWEKIGDTNIDLSNYVQFSDNLGSTEVENIIEAVFGF